MATTEEDMSPIIYGALAGVFLLVLTVFVLFSTGSIITVFILWLVIALILIVLVYYGYIDIEKIFETKKETKTTIPDPASKPKGSQIGSEVFHIADKIFTYDEAQAVCAAYDARVATLEQIIEAFNKGAEWCGYGWSAGGMALYPTQKATWDELQYEIDPKKKTRCGRPGVNGGYFDPMNKFGVNCFGFKPPGDLGGKAPLPIDGQDSSFANAVNRFKEMLKTLDLSPFSRSTWSGYKGGIASKATNYGEGFTQQYGKLVEGFTEHQTNGTGAYVESLYGQGASYTAAPYGLMGPGGATGPTGPQGLQGLAGIQGGIGPQGTAGAKGDQGLKGDQGPQGNDGAVAAAGKDGKDGEDGDTGPKGDPGDTGPAGTQGTAGPRGTGAKGDKGDTGPKGDQGLAGTPGAKGDTGSAASILAYSNRAVGILERGTNIGRGHWQGKEKREEWSYCPGNTLPVGIQTTYHADGAVGGAFLKCI